MKSNLEKYLGNLRSLGKYRSIVAAIHSRDRFYVGGVYGSAYALLLAALADEVKGSLLFVVDRPGGADSALDDFTNLFPARDVAHFPPQDIYDEKENVKVLNLRLSLLARFLWNDPPRLTVTSIEALARPVWPRKALEKNYRRIEVGDELPPKEMEGWLEDRGLRRVPLAEAPGEWSRRGSVLDIYPFSAAAPQRIELFGDTVESIREYNPQTQASVRRLEACSVIAVKTGRAYFTAGAADPPTLLSYLPKESVVFFHNPERMEARVNELFQKTADAKLPLLFERLLSGTTGPARIFVTQLPKPAYEPGTDFDIRSVESFSDLAGSRAALLGSLAEKKKRPW